jgi:hypothetical protein
MLDYFEHPGPKGAHLCVVMELMWQDLCAFMRGYFDDDEERLPLVKEISKKCLECLSALHGCGIVHNGNFNCSRTFRCNNIKDFHLRNLMVSIGAPPSTLSEVVEREARTTDPAPADDYSVFTNVRTGYQSRIYHSQPICLKSGQLFSAKDIRLKVADFGHGLTQYFPATNG